MDELLAQGHLTVIVGRSGCSGGRALAHPGGRLVSPQRGTESIEEAHEATISAAGTQDTMEVPGLPSDSTSAARARLSQPHNGALCSMSMTTLPPSTGHRSPTPEMVQRLRQGTDLLTAAALRRLDKELPWYGGLAAEDR